MKILLTSMSEELKLKERTISILETFRTKIIFKEHFKVELTQSVKKEDISI